MNNEYPSNTEKRVQELFINLVTRIEEELKGVGVRVSELYPDEYASNKHVVEITASILEEIPRHDMLLLFAYLNAHFKLKSELPDSINRDFAWWLISHIFLMGQIKVEQLKKYARK